MVALYRGPLNADVRRHQVVVRPRRHLIFLAATAFLGCAQEDPRGTPVVDSGALPVSSHSVDEFRFIDRDTTVPQVFAKLGNPGRDIGSGIHIYEYLLQDGSRVIIGSPDGSDIWYVRHGSAVLFQQN
jgi:hypothetical protein